MDNICERLNEDYHSQRYIVDFAFYSKKFDCDKLKKYLITKSNNIFIMTGNNRLSAIVEEIEKTTNILHNKIVNYLNNVEEKPRRTYVLNVIDILDMNYEPHNPFDYWLSQSMDLIEKRGKKWDYTFYMKYFDCDFVNRIHNTNYIDYFRTSETHENILEHIQIRKAKRKHKQNTELMKKELDKNIFINKINTLFSFTKNKSDYLSKRVVCDLLDLDYKSQKDIRYLNIILTDYGVGYNDQKQVNKLKGVFFNISLK